jgi:hypothetical protein
LHSCARQAIIRAFRAAGALAVQHVRSAAVTIGGKDRAELRSLLQKCAATSLNSKLVRGPRPPPSDGAGRAVRAPFSFWSVAVARPTALLSHGIEGDWCSTL